MSQKPIRRSQAVSPFGVGAMVDFPGAVSLIHCGLDSWPYDENDPAHHEFRIDDDRRLSERLDVRYFVLPPDYRFARRGQETSDPNMRLKLPFLRFPRWHVCPRCGLMKEAPLHSNAAPYCTGPIGTGSQKGEGHSRRKMSQVRFISVCEHGHIQDFPWWEWIFKSSDPNKEGRLRMIATGSSSLAGVKIQCERMSNEIHVVEQTTLARAFGTRPGEGDSAFTSIGVLCQGHNPALGIPSNDVPCPGCGKNLYPLLRGGSNVYFPTVVSSIYIPEINDTDTSQEILDILDDGYIKRSLVDKALEAENGLITEKMAKNTLKRYRPEATIDVDKLAEAGNRHLLIDLLRPRKIWGFLTARANASPDNKIPIDSVKMVLERDFSDWEIDPIFLTERANEYFTGEMDTREVEEADEERTYRQQEYNIFCKDIQEGYPKTNLLITSKNMNEYEPDFAKWFQRISLVHKLRETRAFAGFSRIFSNNLDLKDRKTLISRTPKDWLPAFIVRGEGLFFQLDKEKIDLWAQQHHSKLRERLYVMQSNLDQMRIRRHQAIIPVTPKFVLLHTLAHILINQFIYDCGYGSASLRERLYCSEGENSMCGILIYTAAGDSEGTMGGLVRMGKPGYIEPIFYRALERSRWCSTDPVCIQSSGQGPDNSNLAACHSCVLLPETSCEEQNRLLDRGLLIGTLDERDIAFFG